MPERLEVLIEGGKATPGAPLGPALGPLGVNIVKVVKDINDKTKSFEGMKVPVVLLIDAKTKDYTIEVGTPPVSALILKEIGAEKGSGEAGKTMVGNLSLKQAVKIAGIKKAVESAPERKFPETVEVAINLKDVDLGVAKNRLDEEVVLPKGRGKPIKVCVFASGDLAFRARDVADLVITPDQMEDLAGDKKKARALAEEYDFFIAEAPLMPVIGKRLGQVLGPRGRMPRPIPPTADPSGLIRSMRNTVRVRTKNQRTFHAP